MAKKEFRSAWEDIGAVMDELPVGAEPKSAYLSDMGAGQTRAIVTLTRGIEKAAVAFMVAELETEHCHDSSGPEMVYFTVGGVSVVQYRARREDEEAP